MYSDAEWWHGASTRAPVGHAAARPHIGTTAPAASVARGFVERLLRRFQVVQRARRYEFVCLEGQGSDAGLTVAGTVPMREFLAAVGNLHHLEVIVILRLILVPPPPVTARTFRTAVFPDGHLGQVRLAVRPLRGAQEHSGAGHVSALQRIER